MAGRLTIGLYNSYDPRKFYEAHRRALVRAAPLALAFDASLAAFGFPFDDLAEHGGRTAENRSRKAPPKRGTTDEEVSLATPLDVARLLAASTSVAEGAPLVTLAEQGRFYVFPLPERGFPPQLGAVVLTTEHAKGPKATTPRAVARELAAGKSQLLVFGLGPHGTPADVNARAAAELDVTGKGQGLETATALGAVMGAIAAHLETARP